MPIFSYDNYYKHNVISWKELVVLICVGLPALIRLQTQKIKHFPKSLGWKKANDLDVEVTES